MKLRSQILIFFLVFGLTPLMAAVVINLPLVFGNLELFYHKAHLQNLRADFRDLDQHLASRQEMVRLLAKLPEPGSVLGKSDDPDQIDVARARYTQWVNQIVNDQLDIIQILFLDESGNERFWLERDPESLEWRPTTQVLDRPPADFIQAVQRLEPGGVLVSRIRLNPQSGALDPRRLMNLYLISAIVNPAERPAGGAMGSVVISIDVGGLAESYRNTLWVNNDGSYLEPQQRVGRQARAFQDFPGLETIFASGKLDLWKGPQGQQVLWVPMFLTENSGPLWVGRQVDPSPLAAFRNALMLRVLVIVLLLIVLVWGMARWVAVRLERLGQELTGGIGLMLKADQEVTFAWRGPQELQTLGMDLTALAHTHAQHAHALRDHARQLEESNRYKSEFLANVSHELRTPLNSILLLSKLLADPDARLGPDQAKQARVIHQAGRDLQGLIDNILDHSRIEARETSLNLDWIDPRLVVAGLMELVQPQFEQKGLFLELEVKPGAPERIRTDPDKVSQILKNFLANAVKFTERGGVHILLERPGRLSCPLALRVSDTGIGIPESKQELVFEAFKQADGSTSRRYGGTGLGLSISRELAHLLGGLIELESVEGQGSTFSLLLPLDPDAPARPDAATGPAMSREEPALPCIVPQADFAGHCLLVVVRDVPTLLELTPLLEGWGIRVTAAADRDEVVECLQDDEPCSALLLDARMFDGDGCATITRIQARQGLEGLPVLALVDGLDGEVAERCREAGADELLVRPLEPDRLKQALERHLGSPCAEDHHATAP